MPAPRERAGSRPTADDLARHLCEVDTYVDELAWHALLTGDPLTPRQVRGYRRALKGDALHWYSRGCPDTENRPPF
ncbi:hypothetical protein [Janibacter indicus]|uniref:Uncharacterized protein n=1 Tax=Janibacter indicus TaxID=857417 RepID=A0A1W1Z6E2_9MICO|nr:hypothetical protein [Janibacter indicus]SMC43872.1 hypothetical protein SAMN06296429_103113 [Janibacter indicus]